MKTVRKGKDETRRGKGSPSGSSSAGATPDEPWCRDPAVAVPERPVGEIVDELRLYLQELGRLRSVRDPLGSLADQLSPPQCHALFWLGVEKALSAGHLADRIGCSLPNLTGIVDRLEKLGYVERGRDTSDRRVVLIRLTEQGHELYGLMSAAFRGRLTEFLEALVAPDRELVVGLLRRILVSFRARTPAAPPPAAQPSGSSTTTDVAASAAASSPSALASSPSVAASVSRSEESSS